MGVVTLPRSGAPMEEASARRVFGSIGPLSSLESFGCIVAIALDGVSVLARAAEGLAITSVILAQGFARPLPSLKRGAGPIP